MSKQHKNDLTPDEKREVDATLSQEDQNEEYTIPSQKPSSERTLPSTTGKWRDLLPPASKGTSRKLFNWPASVAGVKAHRPISKRAFVVAHLTGPSVAFPDGGATYEYIRDSCEWTDRDAREGIKLIHSNLGYGLTEDPTTGIIRAYRYDPDTCDERGFLRTA